MSRSPVANRLLARLPKKDYEGLLQFLDPVALNRDEVLYEPGKPMRQVYFLNDSLVSLLTLVDGHSALEIAVVGREGMLGIPVALGISNSPARAVVQGTGTALRMTSVRFRAEYARPGAFHKELNRHIHHRLIQVTQIAACNRFHHVEARLARWLLMRRDRMETNHFRCTQDHLGDMLGVLRSAITVAAHSLQRKKLIHYSRGSIHILDGEALEAAACGCYQVVRTRGTSTEFLKHG